MAWSTPRTWTVGELLTAANMNTYLSNELLYLHGDSGNVDLSTNAASYAFGANIGSTGASSTMYIGAMGTNFSAGGGSNAGIALSGAGGQNMVRASNSASLIRSSLTSDSQYRYTVDFNGLNAWGPGGSSATDTTLTRSAAGVLKVGGALLTTTGVGYVTGASSGATYTQLTSTTASVAVTTACGQITTFSAIRSTGSHSDFPITFNPTSLFSPATGDILMLSFSTGGTAGTYTVQPGNTNSGTGGRIDLVCITAPGAGESPVINYAVFKGATT